ncbi:hypothetical protein ABZ752_22655 [Streptomyces roseifaciens]
MSRQDVIDAARAYARRNPRDRRQAELLARLEGRTLPPLDLTEARARRAATAAAQRPVRPAAPRTARPVTLAPVRRPDPPAGAVQFCGAGNTWRWAHLDPFVTAGRSWGRLAVGLVAAGPFQCLRVRRDDLPVSNQGQTRFHQDPDDGAAWVDVVVGRTVPAGEAGRVIAHELAHVADEVARLEAVRSTAAWRQEFADSHRTRSAEAFALTAEEWVTTDTTAAQLLAAARDHQEQRRP